MFSYTCCIVLQESECKFAALSAWSGLSEQMLLGMSLDCLQLLIMEFRYDLNCDLGSWEDAMEEQRRWERNLRAQE